jgi:4-diphosphocytidyl-2-C-methyl-D-erythritol kinase
LVVLNPKIHVSTAFAYSAIVPQEMNLDWEASWNSPIEEWQGLFTNDFEKPISDHFPLISEIIQELKNQGALYAAMSGSGSSVFGLFEKTEKPNFSRFQEFLVLNEEIR